MTSLSREDETFLYVSSGNCQILDEVESAGKASKETIEMYDTIMNDMEQSFFPRLRKLIKDDSKSTKELIRICDYIDWAMRSDIKLKFDLTEEDVRYINAIQDRKLYFRHLASDELEAIPNYELFIQLNEMVQILRDRESWTD